MLNIVSSKGFVLCAHMVCCICPHAQMHVPIRPQPSELTGLKFCPHDFVMCPHDTGHVSLRFMACVLMLIKHIHTLRGYVPTLVDMCPHGCNRMSLCC